MNVSLKGDDFQDFDTRWDQALLLASEVHKENVLESLFKMKIRESVQLQTLLAMYDQEIDRDRARPGCKFGEKCVVRHTEIDSQTSKKPKRSGGEGPVAYLKETEQFGCVFQDSHPSKSIPNDVVERGSVTKSQKGKKVFVERKVGVFSMEGTTTMF